LQISKRKKELSSKVKDQTEETIKALDEISNAKWFVALKESRHLIPQPMNCGRCWGRCVKVPD
jgi:hypothetical protein